MKNLKSLLLLVFAMGFLFAVATTSCGPKKAESDTEQVEEHPSESEEHPSEDEHPSGGDEHPSGGDEHPSN